MTRVLLAAAHLLALAIGFGAIHVRARGLLAGTDAGRRIALAADAWWGVAALLWLATGLARAFGGLEKGSAYYLASPEFLTKMALFVLIVALEIWPMVALIGWRVALRQGRTPDTSQSARLGWISHAQTLLLVAMLLLATALARGIPLLGSR
jgi:putative membrane protein